MGGWHKMIEISQNRTVWLMGMVVAVTLLTCLYRERNMQTSYLYAPGLFGSPVVIGRYCSFFYAPTGEIVYGTRGGDIFGDGTLITAVTFSEINLQKPTGWFRRVVAPPIARSILLSRFGIAVRENESSNQTIFNYIVDPRQANIAQDEDILLLAVNFDAHAKKHPNTKIVLFGDSRGAATTFNFLATKQPSHIGCVILEGIFDSMPHVLRHCFHCSWKGDFIERMLHRMLTGCIHRYRREGPFPEQYVDRISRDLPILLVTSLGDEVVPYQSTLRLYQLLKEHGHDRVRILVLKKSRHDSYMVGPERDIYQACVHAFYKYAGVAYNATWAERGTEVFATTNPSIAEVIVTYNLTKKCCLSKSL